MTPDSASVALPTLEDVARVAGVSRATVSRVIRAERRVAPALREVVDRAIEQTGYVPNRAARSLVTGRTGSVVVAVSGSSREQAPSADHDVLADPFFSRVVWACVRALRGQDVHPILMLVESDVDRARMVAQLRQGSADGALLVSTLADDPLPELLTEAGVAAVSFARPSVPSSSGFVDIDHAAGARLAADHLVSRGRRRVAAISGPLDVPAARDRLDGFIARMSQHGVDDVPTVSGNFTLESGEAALAKLVDEHPGIDGIFASNDLMAIGAMHELRDRGRRVPDDVAVVGFDDNSIASLSRPTLTTVRQPMEQMAARMADMLLERLRHPEADVAPVILEPTLVVRAST